MAFLKSNFGIRHKSILKVLTFSFRKCTFNNVFLESNRDLLNNGHFNVTFT